MLEPIAQYPRKGKPMSTDLVQANTTGIPWGEGIPDELQSVVTRTVQRLADIAPKSLDMRVFNSSLAICFIRDPKLTECTYDSIAESLIKCARLGLIPGEDMYLVPFKKGKAGGTVCTPMIGYQAWLKRLNQSPMVKSVIHELVYTRDTFEIDYLSGEMSHRPFRGPDKGEITDAYCCVTMTNGEKIIEIVSRADADKARRNAPRGDAANAPWETNFPEQWRKTTVQRWGARHGGGIPTLDEMMKVDAEAQQLITEQAPHTEDFNRAMADLYGVETPPERQQLKPAAATQAHKSLKHLFDENNYTPEERERFLGSHFPVVKLILDLTEAEAEEMCLEMVRKHEGGADKSA